MDVKVGYRLSGRLADVHADVEAVRRVLGLDDAAGFLERAEERETFFSRRLEPARDVATRDKQGVAWVDGEGVPEADHQLVFEEDPIRLRRTERAGLVVRSAVHNGKHSKGNFRKPPSRLPGAAGRAPQRRADRELKRSGRTGHHGERLTVAAGVCGVLEGWQELLLGEAACKASRTCPRLRIRELYFEPNPGTMGIWRDRYGFYETGIDCRVAFVCESPSDRRARGDQPDFRAGTASGWVCWNYTSQDRRFREARVRHGFQHSLITNPVKCGLPRPSTPAKLTEEETEACSSFLKAEVEMVRPAVLACMGASAFRIVQKNLLPKLTYSPVQLQLTHYSNRGSTVPSPCRPNRAGLFHAPLADEWRADASSTIEPNGTGQYQNG